jgi:hypothetical protein
MVRTLALLVPALIPSWRFFPRVAASPRIEVASLGSADEPPQSWQEFRPRPAHVPLFAMLGRLIWNRRWNETLFIVSSTERFLDSGSGTRLREILSRIRSDLHRADGSSGTARHFQMRIVLLSRENDQVVREEVYRSEVHSLDAGRAA